MQETPANDLQYYYLSPKNDRIQYADILDKTYEFWHDIWFTSLREIEPESELYSDDFSRADYVGVLFHAGKPQMLCLYTYHDMQNNQTFRDSYFRAWPETLLKDLRGQDMSRVLVCSHYTLGRDVRQFGEFKLKDLVLGMIHSVFQDSGENILLATTRNLKKANQLMYSMGCTPLAQDVIYHGEPSDMVKLDIKTSRQALMEKTPQPLRNLIIDLWKNRNLNRNKNISIAS